jgi:ribosomal protein S7
MTDMYEEILFEARKLVEEKIKEIEPGKRNIHQIIDDGVIEIMSDMYEDEEFDILEVAMRRNIDPLIETAKREIESELNYDLESEFGLFAGDKE